MALYRLPGSVLGLSRENPAPKDDPKKFRKNAERIAEVTAKNRIKIIIAVGGDDTLTAAQRLFEANVCVINGVPKTIDNDIKGTDQSFGFETAVEEGHYQAEGMRSEAETGERPVILETMGRNAGWIALETGRRAKADIVLIPEIAVQKAEFLERVREVMIKGRFPLIVASEGFPIDGKPVHLNSNIDPHGNHKLGGVRYRLEGWLNEIGLKAATQEVGYAHRFGQPTEEDAQFAYELGWTAMDAAVQGRYGVVAVEREGKITVVPLSEISGGRLVPEELYDRKLLRMREPPRHTPHRQLQRRTLASAQWGIDESRTQGTQDLR
jgi:6-phosphofructokinase 1